MGRHFHIGKKDHLLLFGSSVDERLDANHEVRFFDQLIEGLDIGMIEGVYSEQGGACYHPRMMIKLLFYGYHRGIRSSRQLAHACRDSVSFIYLAGDLQVRYRAISNFRARFADELCRLFVQIVRLAINLGMVKGRRVCQDGTKIRGSASNDGFGTKEELESELRGLEDELKEYFRTAQRTDALEDELFGKDNPNNGSTDRDRDDLFQRMEALLREERRRARGRTGAGTAHGSDRSVRKPEPGMAEPTDADQGEQRTESQPESENTEAPVECSSDHLPCPDAQGMPDAIGHEESPNTKGSLLRKVRRALGLAKALARNTEEPSSRKLNPVDPDCRFIKSHGRTEANYNGQIVTENGFILAADVTNQAADQTQLKMMVDHLEANVSGLKIGEYLADAGYFSGPNLKHLADHSIEAFIPERSGAGEPDEDDPGAFAAGNFRESGVDELICPAGKGLALVSDVDGTQVFRAAPTDCVQCGFRSECLSTAEDIRCGRRTIRRDDLSKYRDAMRAKMETAEGRAAYRQRSADVEPVFGNVKHNRGFRYFLLRELRKVRGEFILMCGAHDLGKIVSHLQMLAKTGTAPP